MKHRRWYWIWLSLFATAIGLRSQEPAPQGRPNILFCLADDWGWPHAGALGETAVQTPTFDRIARQGVLFERAFVSSPSCTPCRNSILTGQEFYRLGEGANLWSTLDVRHQTFVRELAQAGYDVAHWRKAWGPGDWRAAGYDRHPCGPRTKLAEFLAQRSPERPFCYWFGSSDPHRAYVRGSGERGGIDPRAIRMPAFYPEDPAIRGDLADYLFEVQRFDREVGQALAQLEAAGVLKNTIVVMTGDHGMPFPRCKGNLYDWGTRVPLAICGPGVAKPGRIVTDFVSLPDLAPSFLELAGVDRPDAMTARSLVPLLRSDRSGRVDPRRDAVVFGRERHTPAQAMPAMAGYPARGLRTERWLLIRNLEPERWPAGVPSGATHPMAKFSDCDNGPTKTVIKAGRGDSDRERYWQLCFGRRPAVELYDCLADPFQLHNLAGGGEHAAIVGRLTDRLTGHLLTTGDPRFTPGAEVGFDTYPYRARYLRKHLEQAGYPAKSGWR